MNTRKRLSGTVIRAKTEKTVLVEIKNTYRHPVYGKVMRTSNKMMVHDELNCQVGDKVQIIETKPISRRKRWAVEEVLSTLSENEAPPIESPEAIAPEMGEE